MVSFGVAPGMIVFSMLGQASLPLGEIGRYIPYLAFVIPAFSGLRPVSYTHLEKNSRNCRNRIEQHSLTYGMV